MIRNNSKVLRSRTSPQKIAASIKNENSMTSNVQGKFHGIVLDLYEKGVSTHAIEMPRKTDFINRIADGRLVKFIRDIRDMDNVRIAASMLTNHKTAREFVWTT